MTKCFLALSFLLIVTSASAHGPVPAPLHQSDLVLTGLTDTATSTARLCEQVAFSRGLRYGESEANVLDVATSATTVTLKFESGLVRVNSPFERLTLL